MWVSSCSRECRAEDDTRPLDSSSGPSLTALKRGVNTEELPPRLCGEAGPPLPFAAHLDHVLGSSERMKNGWRRTSNPSCHLAHLGASQGGHLCGEPGQIWGGWTVSGWMGCAVPASPPSRRRSTAGLAASPNHPKGEGCPVPRQETCLLLASKTGVRFLCLVKRPALCQLLLPCKGDFLLSPGSVRLDPQTPSGRIPVRSGRFPELTTQPHVRRLDSLLGRPIPPCVSLHPAPPAPSKGSGRCGAASPIPAVPLPSSSPQPRRRFSPATPCHSRSPPTSPSLRMPITISSPLAPCTQARVLSLLSQ